MVITTKIPPSEFCKYIVSSNNVFFNKNSYFLQSKGGSVSFDFGASSAYCVFNMKRESGNGLVILMSGNKQKEFQVVSARGQEILYDLQDGKIKLHRTIRSRGDLSISEITVYYHEQSPEPANIIDTNYTLKENILQFGDEASELWLNRMNSAGYINKPIRMSFCTIKTIPRYKRVFLNEFDTRLEEKARCLDSFKDATHIITPSLPNYTLLRKKFPLKEIIICGRLLPISSSSYKNPKCSGKKQHQVLAFYKNEEILGKIIKSWNQNIGNLIVVGKLPNNLETIPGVVFVKDILSTDEILLLISSSFLILDIGVCNHYISSIAELVRCTNSNLLTNNTRYVSYRNSSFIKPGESIENIIKQIQQIKSNSWPSFLYSSEYDEVFKNSLDTMGVL